MSNDLGKDFQNFYKKVQQNLSRFPLLAASEAQNFFLDSFRQQAWMGERTEPWAKRKENAKRNKGRALLVDTGRLKRSIRIKQANWSAVVIASDVPYASVHNEGYRGTQTVGAHGRTGTRVVATRYKKDGTASKSGRRRVRTSLHQVSVHTRHQNIPRRRFMGNSPFLDARIQRTFLRELSKIK